MRERMCAIILICFLWYVGGVTVPSCALSSDSLEGKEFLVFMWCDDDVGEYCEEGRIETEEFIFEEENQFYIESFRDDSYFDLDFASGTYEEGTIFFEADFEAVEELVKKYKFKINGLNIFTIVMVGGCEITYYRYKIPEFDYIKEDEANCYFIGFPK